MKYFFYVFLLVLISNNFVYAKTLDQHLKGLIQSTRTSDQVTQTTIRAHWKNPKTDLSWPYKTETDNGWGLQANILKQNLKEGLQSYSGHTANLGLQYKWNPRWALTGLFGFHQIENSESHKTKSLWTKQLVLQSWFLPQLFFQAHYQYDFVYQHLLFGTAGTELTAHQLQSSFLYKPLEKIRIQLRQEHWDFDDKNQKNNWDLAALYGLSPHTPWIWLGLGINSLTHTLEGSSNNKITYWSPKKFLSYSLRGDVSLPIVDQLSGVLEFSWSQIKENDSSWGDGYNYALGLRWGDRNKNQGEVFYTQIHSQQTSSEWNSSSLSTSWLYSF